MSNTQTPLVSVIIVNWNGKLFLQNCLDSLQKQTFKDFLVLLIDNGSKDGSQNFVRQNFPNVKLIPLKRNMGFAEANNIGILETKSKYIATLNNDTEVKEDWLEQLVTVAEENSVSMVASKMLYLKEGRKIIDNIGLRINRNGLGTNIGNGEQDVGQYDNLDEIFAPCAGAALYRRGMLEGIGMFDKDYFAYYEDLDLGWRGRLAGKRSKPAPKALVYHHHSGSASSKKTYFLHRNKIFTLIKNLPQKWFIRYLSEILTTDFLASAHSILSGDGCMTIQGKIDAIKMLPQMLHKRKLIQKNRKVRDAEIEKWFEGSETLGQIIQRKSKF